METDDSLEYSSGLDLTHNSFIFSHHLRRGSSQADDDIVVIEDDLESGKFHNSMSRDMMAFQSYRSSLCRSETTLIAAGYPVLQYETIEVPYLDATTA